MEIRRFNMVNDMQLVSVMNMQSIGLVSLYLFGGV